MIVVQDMWQDEIRSMCLGLQKISRTKTVHGSRKNVTVKILIPNMFGIQMVKTCPMVEWLGASVGKPPYLNVALI